MGVCTAILHAYVWKRSLNENRNVLKGFNVKCCLRGISRTKMGVPPVASDTTFAADGRKGEGKI